MDIADVASLTGGDDMSPALAEFVDEYYWLRSFGMADAAIARALRVSDEVLVKRLQRAKVRRAELSPDVDIDGRLRTLISAGDPFDSWDFPLAVDPFQVAAAISTAVRRGLVVRVGSRSVGAGRGGLFQEVAAAQAAEVATEDIACVKAVVALVRAVAS
ncbi:MAG: hypothetical protein WCE30_12155 [Mycobacterium sp.]